MSVNKKQSPLFKLGNFHFTLNGASLDAFTRDYEFKWSEENRKGNTPTYQAAGKWSEKIELKGVVFTAINGNGLKVVDEIVTLAKKMKPVSLTQSTGTIYGKFVILSINEERSSFFQTGEFLKQTYSLKLGRCDG